MKLFGKRIGIALVLAIGMLAGGVATATPITMDFDGLPGATSVKNYYAGGCTTGLFHKACNGPDYGVTWKGATVRNGYASFFLNSAATMNIAAGFDGGLSFNYYNVTNLLWHGSVGVYSDWNGLGTQLAYANLGATNGWDFLGLEFSGLAKSVIFNGTPFFLTGFDDVTLGVNAVPEPAALGVFGLGLLLMGLFTGLRRRCD